MFKNSFVAKNAFIGVTEKSKLNLILWPNPCFVSSLYVSSFGRPTCSKHRCLIEVDCSIIYLWFHIKVTHFFTSHCAFKPLSGVFLFVSTIILIFFSMNQFLTVFFNFLKLIQKFLSKVFFDFFASRQKIRSCSILFYV